MSISSNLSTKNTTESEIQSANWINLGLFIIPIITICGNVLVALSVHVEKRLQNRFNYFLVSLAVSDLLSATLVMPVSAMMMVKVIEVIQKLTDITINICVWIGFNLLIYCHLIKNEILTKNIFPILSREIIICSLNSVDVPAVGQSDKADIANNWPNEVCLAWFSLDVFFTATTIIHLCTISLDRYFALNNPLKYRRDKHQSSRLYLKIFASWIIPFSIACPLFILAIYLDRTNGSYKGCGPQSALFILTAVIVTFVIPLIIMIITYILTVHTIIVQTRRFDEMMINNPIKSPALSKFEFFSHSKTKRNMCVQNGSCDTSLEGSNSSYHYSEKYELKPMINMNCKPYKNSKERKCFPQSTFSLVKMNSDENYELDSKKTLKLQNIFHSYDEENYIKTLDTLYRPRSSIDFNTQHLCSSYYSIEKDQRFSDQNIPKQHFLSNIMYLKVDNTRPQLARTISYDETRALDRPEMLHLPTEQTNHFTDESEKNQVSAETLTVTIEQNHTLVSQDSLSLNYRPLNASTPFLKNKSASIEKSPIKCFPKYPLKLTDRMKFNNVPLLSMTSKQSQRFQNHTKRNIRKSRKAVQVLGTLFGLFLLCYLPFFLVYIFDFFCPSCNRSLKDVIRHLEWVGYSASMLNPVVYHIFNPIFKMTFRRLLHGNCQKSRNNPHNLSSFV